MDSSYYHFQDPFTSLSENLNNGKCPQVILLDKNIDRKTFYSKSMYIQVSATAFDIPPPPIEPRIDETIS